jgi:hypothetical protein
LTTYPSGYPNTELNGMKMDSPQYSACLSALETLLS